MIEDFVNNVPLQETIRSSLNLLAEICASASRAKGFHDNEACLQTCSHLAPNDFAWMLDAVLQAELARQMSEIGEAVEAIRKPGPDHHLPHHSNFLVEEADVVIRIGDTLGKRGLRLGDAVVDKILYNYGRERLHGKTC